VANIFFIFLNKKKLLISDSPEHTKFLFTPWSRKWEGRRTSRPGQPLLLDPPLVTSQRDMFWRLLIHFSVELRWIYCAHTAFSAFLLYMFQYKVVSFKWTIDSSQSISQSENNYFQ